MSINVDCLYPRGCVRLVVSLGLTRSVSMGAEPQHSLLDVRRLACLSDGSLMSAKVVQLSLIYGVVDDFSCAHECSHIQGTLRVLFESIVTS